LQTEKNELYLSLASLWEIQIKTQLGKLSLNQSLTDTLAIQQQTNGIRLVNIELNHILEVGRLPVHHKDPFDRLLIAQAKILNLNLLTNDDKIRLYDMPRIW
jgi:PIN domain nuclease of toxin-antitoxin system